MFQRQIIWPLTYWRGYLQFLFSHGNQRSLSYIWRILWEYNHYILHTIFSKSILYLFRTSVSCSLTFLCVSTSAGEVMNFFSDNMSQWGFSFFPCPSLLQHGFFIFIFYLCSEPLPSAVWPFWQVSISAGEVMNSSFNNISQQGFLISMPFTLQHGFSSIFLLTGIFW